MVVSGYGVASGVGKASPYPAGAVELQRPHLLKYGVDLGRFYPGTINLVIAAAGFRMTNPKHVCPDVAWTELHGPESFSFSPCRLEVDERFYDGLIYYPHPSTKPLHPQPANLVEVIAERVPRIGPGDAVTLHVDPAEVTVDR